MFKGQEVIATIPATDAGRANKFYTEVLGFEKVTDYSGGSLFKAGSSTFCVYETLGTTGGDTTVASWYVDDVPAAVEALRAKGVTFEEYDYPELKTVNGVADKGDGMLCAWFRDTEGNILAISDRPK